MSRYNQKRSFRGIRTSSSTNPSSTPAREFTEGLLETVVATLHVPSDSTSKTITAEIRNVKCIGSYSWFKEENCSIIVPASPPEWSNKPTPYTLPPDTAERFIDQNGHRMPSAPLLPLIAAVDSFQATETGSLFDWSAVDIVTDRNGLRKLVRWIRNGSSSSARDFRIDLQLAGTKTVLLSRWEQNTKELPRYANTFGINFERATTKEAGECEGASGHHRIVQYDFGGLTMVVRFEVDACVVEKSRMKATISTTHNLQPAVSVDDIVSALGKASITAPAETVSDGETALKIREAGTMIPQHSILELATISRKRFLQGGYDWEEVALQMFISQTPRLYLGIHDRGTFQEVKQKSFSASTELQQAEEKVKPALMKLRKALEDIKRLVVEHGEDGRLSLVCKNGELKVYQRKSTESCLPTDFLDEFL